MSYEIIWEANGVYRRYYGSTNDREILESIRLVEASPQFDTVRYCINDYLEVKEFVVINKAFIEEAAAIDSAAAMTNPNIRVALVTASAEIKKLAEEYRAHFLRPYPTEIFSSLDEARNWAAIETPLEYWFRRRLQLQT